MIYISKLFSPISTGTSAGDIDVGATVKINENGDPVDYLIVHQGLPSSMYDASCEGTWLLRKDIRENGAWNTNNVNTLAGSTIMSTMAGYLTSYDERVQEAIKTVKIPYCVGNGSSTVNSGTNGLECNIFPLSMYEMGITRESYPYVPLDGAKLDYFDEGTGNSAKRIATLNGTPSIYYSRSPQLYETVSSTNAHGMNARGASVDSPVQTSRGIRPTIVLPYAFKFKESEVS